MVSHYSIQPLTRSIQGLNMAKCVKYGRIRFQTFKTRFSQKSEPEHLQKPKTNGKGRRSSSPKNDRVFWHTGLIHVDPGCLMGRIKTIGFSGGYPWFSHFHARSQCTWHCGRLQEPCSWGSRQTWRWIYGGSIWGSDSKAPYRMAPVNHWLRLIGWSETNKYHPYSSIFIHRMQWNAPIPWKKTVEPSETA